MSIEANKHNLRLEIWLKSLIWGHFYCRWKWTSILLFQKHHGQTVKVKRTTFCKMENLFYCDRWTDLEKLWSGEIIGCLNIYVVIILIITYIMHYTINQLSDFYQLNWAVTAWVELFWNIQLYLFIVYCSKYFSKDNHFNRRNRLYTGLRKHL